MIRELVYEDLEVASLLLWKSFYDAEKHNHTMAGLEHFRDLTSPVSLSINTFDGTVVLYGYFEKDKLLAVGAVKERKHVMMLYVLTDYQGQGIGKKLLSFLEERCEGDSITLNSSDVAIGFYTGMGYEVCGKRTVEEELISTPMKKMIKIAENP